MALVISIEILIERLNASYSRRLIEEGYWPSKALPNRVLTGREVKKKKSELLAN